MRLTIIPSDNVVFVDGKPKEFDLSGYPALDDVHAVQWTGTKGHIEFINTNEGEFKLNEVITDISPYQDIVDAWNAAPEPMRLQRRV